MSEKAAKKKVPAKKAAGKKAAKPKKEAKPKTEEKPEKAEVAVERVKLGPAPQPWVLSRHDRTMRHRPAKGYSFGELEAADISLPAAKSLHLHVDSRRRSVLEENTDKLKGWYKAAPKPVREEKPKAEEKAEKPAKAKPKKKKAE
jgi:ribosomal protein L13E